MENRRRHYAVDRRSGIDRRKVYRVGYFAHGNMERRIGKERRFPFDRRTDWRMVGPEYFSIYVGNLQSGIHAR